MSRFPCKQALTSVKRQLDVFNQLTEAWYSVQTFWLQTWRFKQTISIISSTPLPQAAHSELGSITWRLNREIMSHLYSACGCSAWKIIKSLFWPWLYKYWVRHTRTHGHFSYLEPPVPVCTCPPPWVSWCCGLWPVWWGHSCKPSWRVADLAGSHWARLWSTVCARSGHNL